MVHHIPNRNQRLAEVILHELATILQRKSSDPRFHEVTFTAAKVSPDLAHATVYFTVFNEAAHVETGIALNKAAGFLRHQLAESLNLRITPRVNFQYDKFLVNAEHLTTLIHKTTADKKSDNSDE